MSNRRATVIRGTELNRVAAAGFGLDLRATADTKPEQTTRTVEDAVAAGYAAGHDEGYGEGLRAGTEQALAAAAAAERDRFDQVGSCLAALTAAAASLRQRRTLAAADIEDLIAGAAFDLAEAVLGRELALAAAPGRAAVARAMALAPEGVPVTLRLHPDDVATLDDAAAELAGGRDVTLVADAAVESGGCILDAEATRIDAQIGPALERARAALGLGRDGRSPGREG